MKIHLVVVVRMPLFGMTLLVLLLLSSLLLLRVNGQQNETSSSPSCVTAGLQPVLQLDQKVTTLFISMPAFWCEGTLPNDFIFTIEPITPSSSTTTNTSLYTLPSLYSPLLQANQTTDGTTTITIFSNNTVFSAPGSFGVVIQVPASDLQTVIVERSFFFDQNSIKVRIASGFTALRRIACQTLAPYNDAQSIEMDADISTSTSPVTLDLLHHGTYHVMGNVGALNVGHQASLSSDQAATNTGVQIKGNVASGSITRPGLYTVFGNISGTLTVDTTSSTSSSGTSSVDENGASLTTSSSCDNVTLVGPGDACNTVTAGTLANMMVSSLFFSLNCTVIACQETGVPNVADVDQTCLLSTKCPLFGQPEQVPNTAPTSMPTPAPTYGTSGGTAAATGTNRRFLDLLVPLALALISC